MFTNLVLYQRNIYLFKTESFTFLSYIRFELLDVVHGSSILHTNVKCNSLDLAVAIDPPLPPGGTPYTMISRYYII